MTVLETVGGELWAVRSGQRAPPGLPPTAVLILATAAFCLLPTAFCLLPTAHCFCLLVSPFRNPPRRPRCARSFHLFLQPGQINFN